MDNRPASFLAAPALEVELVNIVLRESERIPQHEHVCVTGRDDDGIRLLHHQVIDHADLFVGIRDARSRVEKVDGHALPLQLGHRFFGAFLGRGGVGRAGELGDHDDLEGLLRLAGPGVLRRFLSFRLEAREGRRQERGSGNDASSFDEITAEGGEPDAATSPSNNRNFTASFSHITILFSISCVNISPLLVRASVCIRQIVPPAARMISPVTQRASSEARKTARGAMSSTWPSRLDTDSFASVGATSPANMADVPSVAVCPGAMAFTRMFLPPSSKARPRVRFSTAILVDE